MQPGVHAIEARKALHDETCGLAMGPSGIILAAEGSTTEAAMECSELTSRTDDPTISRLRFVSPGEMTMAQRSATRRQIARLNFEDGQVVVTPKDRDIFLISAEKATEACRNAV